MSTSRPAPPGTVPTLTEVVAWPAGEARRAAVPSLSTSAAVVPVATQPVAPAPVTAASASSKPITATPEAAATQAHLPSEEELARRVIADLQRHIDLMLDVRLKEALAPILTRATDALVRDVRNQLASTLRDVVTRAVAKELNRPPRP